VEAVEILTGSDVLSSGDAIGTIMAGAATPAVFEPVMIDGVAFHGRGVVNNTPISHAVALAKGLHALSLMLHEQVIDGVEQTSRWWSSMCSPRSAHST